MDIQRLRQIILEEINNFLNEQPEGDKEKEKLDKEKDKIAQQKNDIAQQKLDFNKQQAADSDLLLVLRLKVKLNLRKNQILVSKHKVSFMKMLILN
jgi:hypothetical protein